MKPYFLFTCLLFASLVSCNRVNNHNDADSISDNDPVDDYYANCSHFAYTLSYGEYHQKIIEVIANGDKQLFAKMVCYPLERRYPLPDIENEEQMIRYFDTLFDAPFREKVSKLDSNSWSSCGWRGWSILDGEIWDRVPGIDILYSSPLEQQYIECLRDKDMARLHESLQGEWRPCYCFQLDASEYPDFEYFYARVDVSKAEDEDAAFRVALYRKGESASVKPSVVMLGQQNIEGSMCNESFLFESDNCKIFIWTNDEPHFYMQYKNGKEYSMTCHLCMQPFDK